MENLIPQHRNFNRGAYNKLGRALAREVKAGKTVDVDIRVHYGGTGARPTGMTVKYRVDDEPAVTRIFVNAPGGV